MIGGKVLDSSALAEYVQGSIAMETWLKVASLTGLVLYLPALVLSEVRAVFPDRLGRLGQIVQHSQVVYRELDRADAPKVAKLLADSRVWDGTAGHVVLVARQRGWPVLSADPDRLRRIAPDLDVDLL